MAEPRSRTFAASTATGIPSADGSDLPDDELLRRFAHHQDHAAFEMLVHRHGSWVLGVCRRILGNSHDAEDAFQATFVVLARKAATLQWGAFLSNWLHGVAQRTAMKAKVMAARRNKHEQNHAEECERRVGEQGELQRIRAILDEELQLLPAKFRHPLLKHYLEGKSREETAQELGWTIGAVKGSLERGREILRSRLTKRGFACTTTAIDVILLEAQAFVADPEMVIASHRRCHQSTEAPRGVALANLVLSEMRWRKVKPILAMIASCCLLIGLANGWMRQQPPIVADDSAPAPLPFAVEFVPEPKVAVPAPKEEEAAEALMPHSESQPTTVDMPDETIAMPYLEPAMIQPIAYLMTPDGWFVVRNNLRTGDVTIAPLDDWDDDDE